MRNFMQALVHQTQVLKFLEPHMRLATWMFGH